MPYRPIARPPRPRHGRVELRTLKAVSVSGLGFSDAAQVAQVARKARDLGTCRWQTVTVYAITSLAEPMGDPDDDPCGPGPADNRMPAASDGRLQVGAPWTPIVAETSAGCCTARRPLVLCSRIAPSRACAPTHSQARPARRPCRRSRPAAPPSQR
jgi:hypothetical protein